MLEITGSLSFWERPDGSVISNIEPRDFYHGLAMTTNGNL
jgi:hypothetical protein